MSGQRSAQHGSILCVFELIEKLNIVPNAGGSVYPYLQVITKTIFLRGRQRSGTPWKYSTSRILDPTTIGRRAAQLTHYRASVIMSSTGNYFTKS